MEARLRNGQMWRPANIADPTTSSGDKLFAANPDLVPEPQFARIGDTKAYAFESLKQARINPDALVRCWPQSPPERVYPAALVLTIIWFIIFSDFISADVWLGDEIPTARPVTA